VPIIYAQYLYWYWYWYWYLFVEYLIQDCSPGHFSCRLSVTNLLMLLV